MNRLKSLKLLISTTCPMVMMRDSKHLQASSGLGVVKEGLAVGQLLKASSAWLSRTPRGPPDLKVLFI